MRQYQKTLGLLQSDDPDYHRAHREALSLLAAIDKDPSLLISFPAGWRFTDPKQAKAKIRQCLKDIAKKRVVKLILYLRANYRHLSVPGARSDTGEIEFLMKAEDLSYDGLGITPPITHGELQQMSLGNQNKAIKY